MEMDLRSRFARCSTIFRLGMVMSQEESNLLSLMLSKRLLDVKLDLNTITYSITVSPYSISYFLLNFWKENVRAFLFFTQSIH